MQPCWIKWWLRYGFHVVSLVQKSHQLCELYDSLIVLKIPRSHFPTIIMLVYNEKDKLFDNQDIMKLWFIRKLKASMIFVCDLVILLPVVFQLYINYSRLYFGGENAVVVIFFQFFDFRDKSRQLWCILETILIK